MKLTESKIFKLPIAISQSSEFVKGCTTGYVTGAYRDRYGNWIPTSCGGYSCAPYNKNCIDASYCGTGFGVGVGVGAGVVVGGGAIVAVILVT